MTIIDDILKREGSAYTNDPVDAGGPTKWGVTQATLEHYRKHNVTPGDVEALTRSEAYEVYESMYGQPLIKKNKKLKEFMMDSGVLYGPSEPVQWLQQILGTKVDGVMGPVTLRAMSLKGPQDLLLQMIKKRVLRIGEVVSARPSQVRFLKGWLNRTMTFI